LSATGPATAEAAERPWAFWSPASDELIEAALTLAGIGPGVRFLDVGCGDGRVLVAAGKRGAEVRGIELDATLASASRRALGEAGLSGAVEEADFFRASLDADVVYSYLTPVTLARLVPRFKLLPKGTKIVTARYGLTGYAPAAEAGSCFLYEIPLEESPPGDETGWGFRGMIVVVPPGRRCLVPLRFSGQPGDVSLEVGVTLRRAARLAVGADRLEGPGLVAVDVEFEPCAEGSVAAGSLWMQGKEMALAVVFSRGTQGQWGFGGADGEAYRAALQRKIAEARSKRKAANADAATSAPRI
jgi:SAM-dependent methyltransferase